MAWKTLTPLQDRFVKEYVLDYNGTQAFIRASSALNDGKKPKYDSAAVTATKYLKMAKVQKALKDYNKEIDDDLFISAKSIKEGILETISASKSLDGTDRAFSSELKGYELLGKTKAMFVDKVDAKHSGEVDITVTLDDEDME